MTSALTGQKIDCPKVWVAHKSSVVVRTFAEPGLRIGVIIGLLR